MADRSGTPDRPARARVRRALPTAPLLAAALLGASLVAACGFQPVYAPAATGAPGPAAASLAEITVGIIPERSGQLLRLALQERFERAGIAVARRYDLSVVLAISGEGIGIQDDSSATRLRLVATATYTLRAQDPTRSTVTSGVARSTDGFNLFNEQYFAIDLENEAVQRRLTEAVADQIALRLASYFDKQATAKPS